MSNPADHDDDAEDAPRARTWHQAAAELKRLFARADVAYSGFGCPASAACCQLSTTKREPYLWPVEWRLLWEHAQRSKIAPAPRADGGCPFLDPGGKRCRVYEARPLGCRTFFCGKRTGPSREPSEAMADLSRRIEYLSIEQVPEVTAPLRLTEWLAEANARGA